MPHRVADELIRRLAEAGVERIYGVVGDSLNPVTDALRLNTKVKWIHVRHEEAGAYAAGAEAQLTGKLAVCGGSCGPGNLHLINGLYDCHRSRLPVLVIAAQIPSVEVGTSYFQETKPEHLFRDCSHYVELVSQPEQMPRVLGIAMRTAIAKRGVAVIIIPGDVGLRECASEPLSLGLDRSESALVPPADTLKKAAQILNQARTVAILGGAGCAGSHAQLLAVAEQLKAPIV